MGGQFSPVSNGANVQDGDKQIDAALITSSKPRSYASPKLCRLTDLLTGVKCRATSVAKKLVPEKSIGTGIGKIWYRKKVSEPVSEKFGTGKSLGTETFIFVAKI